MGTAHGHADRDPAPGWLEPARCAECGAALDSSRVRREGTVELASCTGCGLQWVRRDGEAWAEIRG